MVFGWPPCTHLASSGARHWAAKRAADPAFQTNAIAKARAVETLATQLSAPFMIENPVGALCTQWRRPDYTFNPCDYAGYLPIDDEHPKWPDYIAPRDAYNERTCIWSGNDFIMPPEKPVPALPSAGQGGSDPHNKLGGKSLKTKNIRSATPRGFFCARCL